MRWLSLLFVLIVLPSIADAVNCGVGQSHTTCQCGDTIATDYTFPADLTCPTGDGVVIGKGTPTSYLNIDGAGHWLIGAFADQTRGLYFNRSAFAVVSNLNVKNFNTGVRFRNTHHVWHVNSRVVDNGLGTRASTLATGSNNYQVEYTTPTDTSTCLDYAGNSVQCCPNPTTAPCLYDVHFENNQVYATTDVLYTKTLAAPVSAGATTITLNDVTNVQVGMRLVINKVYSEILYVLAIAGNVVTVAQPLTAPTFAPYALVNSYPSGATVEFYNYILTPDESMHFATGQKSGAFSTTGGDCVTPDANYGNIIVDGNTIKDGDNENVYPFQIRCATISNNLLTRTPFPGTTNSFLNKNFTPLYIKDSHHLTILTNTISQGVTHTTGDSYSNTYVENVLTHNGYFFDKYPSEAKPTNNLIDGGSVNAPNGNCLRFEKCSGQMVRNLNFLTCSDEVLADDFGTADTTSATIISPIGFAGDNWAVRNGATVDVGIVLNATVTNQNEVPLQNATVTLTRIDTTQAFTATTDSDGKIPAQDVILYRQTAGGTTAYGPFTRVASHACCASETVEGINLVIDVDRVIVLFDPSQQIVRIETPVTVAPGDTQTYYGLVTVRGGGQLRSSAATAPMGYAVKVQGDLLLETGATRLIANQLGMGGDLTLTVTGALTVRGGISSAGIATGRTSGGALTIKANVITLDGATITTDGGRDVGKAGALTLDATTTLTIKDATIKAVGAAGGVITIRATNLVLTQGAASAFGKASIYDGAVFGFYKDTFSLGSLFHSQPEIVIQQQ